jgi:hypothetical protein
MFLLVGSALPLSPGPNHWRRVRAVSSGVPKCLPGNRRSIALFAVRVEARGALRRILERTSMAFERAYGARLFLQLSEGRMPRVAASGPSPLAENRV